MDGLSKDEAFYLAFCSRDEIIQLRKLNNPNDYLLWLQAEAIVDDPRLVRVFRKRRKNNHNWSLSEYYKKHYSLKNKLLPLVSKGKRIKLTGVPTGMAYIDKVNAMCIKSEYGNVVVLSEPLEYFLYFMNIFYLGDSLDIEWEDRSAALLIAVRLMLGNESFDFDLDTRCNLPEDIEDDIQEYTYYQLLFVLGHEYGHHLLGHLNDSCLKNMGVEDICRISESKKKIKTYVYQFKKEYDADLESIKMITNNSVIKENLLNAAFLFFIYFDLIDAVRDFTSPSTNSVRSHPEPLNRLWKLRKRVSNRIGLKNNELESYIEFIENVKNDLVQNFMSTNMELIDMYGSIYLPSFKKKRLIDRVDY